MKKNKITEADIKGVDELVYNPATKKGGSIGYGYDNGQRKEGITWRGHDNHLHIGFTDRYTAIAIIDKANSMGLNTSENPYAKKDPNNKVDTGHAERSLHYKNFPGSPLVGMAVDISGNQSKITELIKWIESKYSNGTGISSTNTENSNDTDSNDEDGGAISDFAKKVENLFSPVSKEISSAIREDIDRIKELLK
jgi:hypothetical protein